MINFNSDKFAEDSNVQVAGLIEALGTQACEYFFRARNEEIDAGNINLSIVVTALITCRALAWEC